MLGIAKLILPSHEFIQLWEKVFFHFTDDWKEVQIMFKSTQFIRREWWLVRVIFALIYVWMEKTVYISSVSPVSTMLLNRMKCWPSKIYLDKARQAGWNNTELNTETNRIYWRSRVLETNKTRGTDKKPVWRLRLR